MRDSVRGLLVVAGGVIPAKDHEVLDKAGCAAVFGPGTVIPTAAKTLLETLLARIGDRLRTAAARPPARPSPAAVPPPLPRPPASPPPLV